MEKNLSLQGTTPTINLFNRQRRLRIESVYLKRFLRELSVRLKVEKGFSLVIVSDQKMREFNRDFASKDYPTDVLSFPFFDDTGMEEDYLGDIVISAERAAFQAKKGLDNELRILALHGLLHLMGYDHERDSGQMKRLENKLRKELDL